MSTPQYLIPHGIVIYHPYRQLQNPDTGSPTIFVTEATHGKLYQSWRWPKIVDERMDNVKQMLQVMVEKVRTILFEKCLAKEDSGGISDPESKTQDYAEEIRENEGG